MHEHRGRLGFHHFLHHRQESTLEIETGAELHVRLLVAEADLPLATMGERLVTTDTVVKGRSKAADVHAELAASWPARRVLASRSRGGGGPRPVRRIRRLAAVSLFVAGAIDLLSSVTTPCASTCISSRSTSPSPWCRRPGRSPPSPASA